MTEDIARAVCQALKSWPGCDDRGKCVEPCDFHNRKPLRDSQCWRRGLWVAEAIKSVVAARDPRAPLVETIPNSDPIEAAMTRLGFDPSDPSN